MKNKQDNARRRILKSIAIGSAVTTAVALPNKWTKPAVNAALLPSHAEMSTSTFFGEITDDLTASLDSPANSILDIFGKKAFAQAEEPSFYLCIKINGDRYDATLIRSSISGNGFHDVSSGEFSIKENLVDTIQCGPIPGAGSLFVNPPAGDSIAYDLIDAGSGSIPRSPCMFFPPACIASDVNIKDNFAVVNQQDVLDKLIDMPVEYWNYKNEGESIRHIGPMAQDFIAAFEVGDSDKHIHMVDANGINIAAIQALNQRLEEKDARIERLEEQIAILMEKIG